MKVLTKAIKVLLPVTLVALMFGSCVKDREIDRGGQSTGDGEKLVRFSLVVPGNANPGTRALSTDEEDEVTEVSVLVVTTVSGHIARHEIPTSVSEPSGGVRQFEVTLPVGTYNLVVIANANSIITSKYPGGIPKSTSLESVRNTLSIDLGEGTTAGDQTAHKWNVNKDDPQTGYLIPMWGHIPSVEIKDTDENQNIGKINLYRDMARIDVRIPFEDKDQKTIISESDFEFLGVTLHNYNRKGLIMPDVDNGENWHNLSTPFGKANTPTLPEGSGFTVSGEKKYQQFGLGTITSYIPPANDPANNAGGKEKVIRGNIYTFEANKGTDYTDRPCVIIYGKWKGTDAYYRVNMDAAANKAPLHILRNHRYIVWVKKITGPGSGNIDDAYKSTTTDIEAKVIPWNEADINTDFDGSYSLSVSETQIEVSGAGGTGTVTLKTNYTGWEAAVYSDVACTNEITSAWLTVSPSNGTSATPTNGTAVTLTATANSGGERTEYVKFSAGKMWVVVEVRQTKGMPGVDAVPGILAVDEKGELNLDGKGKIVYFKFGSMVALWGSDTVDDTFDADDIAWASDDALLQSLKTQVGTSTGKTAWEKIPHSDNGTFPLQLPAQGLGDPCKLMNKDGVNWRMPTGKPYEKFLYTTQQNSNPEYKNEAEASQLGYSSPGMMDDVNNQYYPAAGFRNSVDGSLLSVGSSNGYYWSTVHSTNSGYCLNFTSGIVYPSGLFSRAYGFSVRCVRVQPGEGGGGISPDGGVPAEENIISVDKDGILNLDGEKREGNFIVHFKFNSVVAISGKNVTFDESQIAWTPEGYNYTALKADISAASASEKWGKVPFTQYDNFVENDYANGVGDPCRLAVKDGVAGKYMTPRGVVYPDNVNVVKGQWTNNGRNNGHYNQAGTQFYPTVGYRDQYAGGIVNQTTVGYYWSATPHEDMTSNSFTFNRLVGDPNCKNNRAYGFAIRCVRDPLIP